MKSTELLSPSNVDFSIIVRDLQAIVGQDRLSVAQADRALHARDQSAHPERMPDVIVWPKTTAEVSAILVWANEARLPVTAWGAGTSLEGNSIPVCGGLVLNFQQMNQILVVYETDLKRSDNGYFDYRWDTQFGTFVDPPPTGGRSPGDGVQSRTNP